MTSVCLTLVLMILVTSTLVRCEYEVFTYEVSTTSTFTTESDKDSDLASNEPNVNEENFDSTARSTSEGLASISPEIPPLLLRCPIGMFKCLRNITKNNQLNSRSSDQFVCIDSTRVCNGFNDCPFGEDESDRLCTRQNIGCYLCKGTTNQCITMTKVCNQISDCPLGDDESDSVCNRSSSTKPGGSFLDSRFFSNQLGQTNIHIVNKDSGNIAKERSQLYTNNWKDNATRPNMSSQGTVQDGVGFMFRVDNFVIYNSEVKMFNQDSENVAHPNKTNQSERYQELGRRRRINKNNSIN